jgi:hypothetical protein
VVANEPPIGSLFSAFLGFNPIKELLGPTGALQHLSPSQLAYVTGRSFFPRLIEQPFASGLHLAFTFAAIATAVAIIASAFRGKRYLHATEPAADELADGAAGIGGITGFVEPVASSDADIPVNGNGNGHGQLATAEQSGGAGADRGSDSPGSS